VVYIAGTLRVGGGEWGSVEDGNVDRAGLDKVDGVGGGRDTGGGDEGGGRGIE
jgi:hypothetical protein